MRSVAKSKQWMLTCSVEGLTTENDNYCIYIYEQCPGEHSFEEQTNTALI